MLTDNEERVIVNADEFCRSIICFESVVAEEIRPFAIDARKDRMIGLADFWAHSVSTFNAIVVALKSHWKCFFYRRPSVIGPTMIPWNER